MHKFDFDFGWGSAPHPAGGAYSAPPDPLAGFKGGLLLREGWKIGRKVEGIGEGRFNPCAPRGSLVPPGLPWNASWIQNSDFLTNERRGQTDAHKWA